MGQIQEVDRGEEVSLNAKQRKSVRFAAQIKRIQMTIDVCGDKGGEIKLVFRDEHKTLEKLNGLMKMDSEVTVMVEG